MGVSFTLTKGVSVHQGFLNAYNSVVLLVLGAVRTQLAENPSYSLVVTGHSLGGALASIASVSLKANFPFTPLKLFTFGQPRTGSSEYAALVEKLVGADNIFRGKHLNEMINVALNNIIMNPSCPYEWFVSLSSASLMLTILQMVFQLLYLKSLAISTSKSRCGRIYISYEC